MWYNKVNVISTVEFGLRGTNLLLNTTLVWIRTVENGLAKANNTVFSRNQVDLFILYVLGGNATFNKSELYGMNMWDTLSLDLPSPREEIIHNYDMTTGAIRQGDYKVIVSFPEIRSRIWILGGFDHRYNLLQQLQFAHSTF